MFYAHRPEDITIIDKSKWQEIKEHNQNVGELAKYYLRDLSEEIQSIGYLTGYYHDIGKYSKEFQDKLINFTNDRVDHSTAGGRELINKNFIAGLSILAHHGGLFNLDKLKVRLNRDISDYSSYKDYQISVDNIKIPNLSFLSKFDRDKDFYIQSYIRFILSSLVDSDFIDTERYMNIEKSDIRKSEFDSLEGLTKKLDRYIRDKVIKSDNSLLNSLRNEVRNKCIESAKLDTRVFSLSAPTGIGKTLASISFALNKAIKEEHRRIIYCIPYNNIIIQIAKEFRSIFEDNNVLEHHSNVIYSESEFDKLLATENWDYPIIVTTNVQFFESLMGAKTSKLRKLHNIINSVIVLDEAQMLPIQVLEPCLKLLEILVREFNCSVLLSSATQPDYSIIESFRINPYLIAKDLFTDKVNLLKRVNYIYLDKIDYSELISKMESYSQVLVVVNSRETAKTIFRGLNSSEDNIYLTNSLMPIHKEQLLDKIKFRLLNNQPCRVIATSLIEAGVDLDFPVGFRELTGLDSIIQTGGRVNREGKRLLEESNLYVFELEKDVTLRNESANISIARRLIKEVGINHPEIVSKYFEILFNFSLDKLDEYHILKHNYQSERSLSETYSFKTMESRFKLIEDNDYSIFVPFIPEGVKFNKEEIRHPNHLLNIIKSKDCKITKSLRREISRYSVQVSLWIWKDFIENGFMELINGIYVLRNSSIYEKNLGL